MSSTESSSAPQTPPFPNTPDIGVRAVIALPSLELTASYSPDDDAVKKLPNLIIKVSEQFDNAFSPETPFDFVDFKCYPGELSISIVVFPLNVIELDSDEESSTFRQALPQGHHNMAVIIEPAPQHGNIMKRLKETIEAERKQHKLIMEMDSDSGMKYITESRQSLLSSHSYLSEEGQESQDYAIIDTNSGDH